MRRSPSQGSGLTTSSSGDVATVVTTAMMTSRVNRRPVEHAEVPADVEHDQLGEAPGVHEHARAPRTPGRPAPATGRRAPAPISLPAQATRRIRPSCQRPSRPIPPMSTLSPVVTKKTGRRMAATDSSRSRTASASGPRGKTAPSRKAPKISWMPMAEVTKAQARRPATTRASSPEPSGRSPVAGQRRPDDDDHEQPEADAQDQDVGQGPRPGGGHDGHDHGQGGPRQHVVAGGRRHGQHAQGRVVELALLEDAGQHREGGGRHGRADEEGEGQEVAHAVARGAAPRPAAIPSPNGTAVPSDRHRRRRCAGAGPAEMGRGPSPGRPGT